VDKRETKEIALLSKRMNQMEIGYGIEGEVDEWQQKRGTCRQAQSPYSFLNEPTCASGYKHVKHDLFNASNTAILGERISKF
jgi:hypothetical protein